MLSILLVAARAALAGAGESYAVVFDFEAEAELNAWESDAGVELSTEHATSGTNSMKVRFGDYLVNWGKRDWSRYDLFEFDVFNDTGNPAILRLVIGDGKMKKVDGENVWNAFTRPFDLKVEHNTVSLPVVGLSRGGGRGKHRPREHREGRDRRHGAGGLLLPGQLPSPEGDPPSRDRGH